MTRTCGAHYWTVVWDTCYPIWPSRNEFVLSHVLSNSSMDAFPENTLTQYVTKLPDRFDLLGEWEVGLSEILYPISWYNVSKEDVQLEMYHVNPSSSSSAAAVHDISPPPGHYDCPDALVKQINATIALKESKKNLIRFSYNEISKKITINFGPDAKLPTVLVMSKMFAELVGFSLVDVKSILSKHKKKGKEDDNWWKIKGTANRYSLAPTFATCNAVSTRFSFTATSWNIC